MPCQMDVVESDYGQVVRYAKSGVEGSVHNADCGHIVGAHDCSRWAADALELLKSNLAAFNSVIALDDKIRGDSDADCRGRFLKCLLARPRGVQVVRA